MPALADDAAVERSVTRVAKALGMTDAHIAATKRGELASSEVYQALRKHPAPSKIGLESQDYWIVQEARDRPAAALVHRAFGRRNDGLLTVEWRYYVSHTFNSMLVVMGVLPLDAGGSVFVYANRTFTDQVAGFMGGAARGIGRKIMRGEIEDLYAAFQKAVAPGGADSAK